MVMISGSAVKRDGTTTTPAAGVLIEAYSNSDPNTPMVSAMSDASGNYTISIPTGGVPVDGYLKATLTGYLDTYLYPPHPLAEDMHGSINMPTTNTIDLLTGTLCGTSQDYAMGIIALGVHDAADMTVAGATIASQPAAARYCYNANGYPNRNATATDVDGLAYMINVPAGNATISAMMSGTTFRSHAVNARPNAVITTTIAP